MTSCYKDKSIASLATSIVRHNARNCGFDREFPLSRKWHDCVDSLAELYLETDYCPLCRTSRTGPRRQMLIVGQCLLAIVEFLVINWQGKYSISSGYYQISFVRNVEEAPLFNKIFRILAPTVFLVLVVAGLYSIGLDGYVRGRRGNPFRVAPPAPSQTVSVEPRARSHAATNSAASPSSCVVEGIASNSVARATTSVIRTRYPTIASPL